MVRVQTRITLILAITAAAISGMLVVVQDGWRKQVDSLLVDRVRETDRVLRRVIELRANGARLHANDYTRWDEFVTFTRERDLHWADINITEAIGNFDLDLAWVLDTDCNVIFTVDRTEGSPLAPITVLTQGLRTALRAVPIRHFFCRTPRGPVEVWTSPIQGSEDLDRTSLISGYYVVGRLWTSARITELAWDGNAHVRLLMAGASPPQHGVSSGTGTIQVAVPLEGLNGALVATVLSETTNPLLTSVYSTLRVSAFVMIVGGVCIVVGIGWAIRQWVSRPLSVITQALLQQNPALLASSSRRHDELGHLAGLVEDFFAQREKLIEAREAATLAVAAKSQFLANISHELRTPMHGILSYSRFGLKGAMTSDRETLLDDFQNIESCGTSLLGLLDDLLDLAKLEAGGARFEFAATALEEIVGEAADEFASTYDEKSLRMEVTAENPLEPAVVDRRKILQVMRNLVSNAAKFSPHGGTVWVRLSTSADLARIVVEDSGTGIPAAEVELVFEKFVQASNISAKAGGTGLGLAICREIVDAHRGRIWAENRAEGGARFILELPLHRAVDEEQDLLRTNGDDETNARDVTTIALTGVERRTAA